MSVYIEDFLGKSIRMLLDGDGHSFINTIMSMLIRFIIIKYH
jgi:hypothetical protein